MNDYESLAVNTDPFNNTLKVDALIRISWPREDWHMLSYELEHWSEQLSFSVVQGGRIPLESEMSRIISTEKT